MKLLILSDSHGELEKMRFAIHQEAPNAVFHLGDHDSDAALLCRQYPQLPIYYVSGNCDRLFPWSSASRIEELEGVRILAAHGHQYNVKYGHMNFYMAAREAGAKLALFGHTHEAFCESYEDLWLLNPGSCKGYGASYAVAYISDGQVVRCEIKYL
ncbi:MAG: metallophosphoesterase [Oscillospiraceae bacterium]|nr:metallophosphoesterase [Oscillospiraceae bacterium]